MCGGDCTTIKFFSLLCEQPTINVNVDYTPQWTRGRPSSYIDSVTFPRVFTDKRYTYRVRMGGKDLGVRDPYGVQSDGSQKVNFLEYNSGHGIADKTTICVSVIDPDTCNEYLIAKWN